MPVCSNGSVTVDYTEDGASETVVLIHSSVSGNRQWRALVDALKERFRLVAVNLFGYGETPPWPGTRLQTLSDQAELALALCEGTQGPIHIVGHSFGASVAAWDAVMNEETTIAAWKALEPRTLVVSASGTRRPIREIVELLADACPQWTYAQVAEGGHMAPVTRPELVNPIVKRFLDREE